MSLSDMAILTFWCLKLFRRWFK